MQSSEKLWKTLDVRNYRNNNLVTTKKIRCYLMSEPNYYTTYYFPENS